jgi:hypothetical protein
MMSSFAAESSLRARTDDRAQGEFRMRLIPAVLAATLAIPAIAQTPDCERLATRIRAQQDQVFLLNVAAASQAVPRATAESVDTRLHALSLLTALQSNIQIAIAAKCEVGSIVVDQEPDGANAGQCGAKIKAAQQQNNKANLAAAYRLPACGGRFEEQAKAAEAEAARLAAQPKPPPQQRPRAGVDQEDWRRRVEAWTARRAQCRASYPDNERMVAECAGPIPEPRR